MHVSGKARFVAYEGPNNGDPMQALRTVAALMVLGLASTAWAEAPPHTRIAPGMTMTDVQALMGQPYAIKSLRWHEALFYCPPSWLGRPIGQPIYTTVWLVHRRVVSSRTLIAPNLDTCEMFVAAFQWSDPPPSSTVPHGYHRYSRSHDGGSSGARPRDSVASKRRWPVRQQ